MIQLAMLLLSMTVHGRVVLDGNPLPGVTVTLTQNGRMRTTVSDIGGNYAFDHVQRGAYSLNAKMESLHVVKVRGTSIEMSLDQNIESLCLDCCPNTACPPVPSAAVMSWTPAPTHLPVARGIAGALDLAPGVH